MKTHGTKTQRGFTLIELLVVITIIAILAGLAFPAFAKISEKGKITQAINNCKQIIISLRLYSGDNGGLYPDADRTASPADANDAFRLLFVQGILETEKIFGCGASRYIPDGNIGTSPNYTDAVAPGENHWMMTAGLNDSASGGIPLVFENSLAGTGGDPAWNADAAGRLERGRTWSGGKVIIGMNDSSVEVMPCASARGSSVNLKSTGSGGTNAFTQNSSGGSGGSTLTFLDIADGGK